jgi:ComF family protein
MIASLMQAVQALGSRHVATCLLCQLYPVQLQYSLCKSCWTELPWLLQSASASNQSISHPVQAACHYGWPVDRLIHLYKYQQRLDVLPVLRDILLRTSRPSVQALIAVPSSPERLVTRGFNPASLLAHELSKAWQIPVWQPLNRHHTPAQQNLSRAERLTNLQDAFYINTTQCRVIYRKVLIIDDVITTGSTLNAIHQQLESLGVQQIQSLVIAQA